MQNRFVTIEILNWFYKDYTRLTNEVICPVVPGNDGFYDKEISKNFLGPSGNVMFLRGGDINFGLAPSATLLTIPYGGTTRSISFWYYSPLSIQKL